MLPSWLLASVAVTDATAAIELDCYRLLLLLLLPFAAAFISEHAINLNGVLGLD